MAETYLSSIEVSKWVYIVEILGELELLSKLNTFIGYREIVIY